MSDRTLETIVGRSPLARQAARRTNRRNVAIVFQSFALFPWLNVLENVEAPLEARGVGAIERRKRALQDAGHRRSRRLRDRLSQRTFRRHEAARRVSPARWSSNPKCCSWTSPSPRSTSSPPRTCAANYWNSGSSKKMPTSAIFIVTHNIEEAVLLADRVIVLGKNPGAHSLRFRSWPAAARATAKPRALSSSSTTSTRS